MNAIKEAHYNLGIAYLEEAEYSRAVPEFEAAIKLDPNFIAARCALARAYLEQDILDDASAAVKAALVLDAGHQPAQLLCATITEAYYNQGKDFFRARRYTEAVSTFQQALTLNTDMAEGSQVSDTENKHIYAYLGASYIGMKAYPEAIAALGEAIALDPDLVDAHYNLGQAYVEQGIYPEAIPHLDRAIAIAPNHNRAHYHLARAYQETGNLEAATNAIKEALRLAPDYQPARETANAVKQAHYNSGITHRESARYSEAVTAFQNAITLDPDFAMAYYNLGVTYHTMETYPRAVEALQKTIALDRTHKEAYHALALAHLGGQELGKAIAVARELLELDPTHQRAISLLAALDPNFTPPETATEKTPEQTQERTHSTTSPTGTATGPKVTPPKVTHYELGLAYQQSKMHAEAIAEFQKAIALDPDFVEAHTALGAVHLEAGDHTAAENAVKQALSIDPNAEPARKLLTVIEQTKPAPSTEIVVIPPDPPADSGASDDSDSTEEANKHLERGEAFLDGKQYQESAAAFKKAIKADPSFADAHYGLGIAYLEMGATDDARAAAEEAAKFTTEHQAIHELLDAITAKEKEMKRRRTTGKIPRYLVRALLAIAVLAGGFWAYNNWWPSGGGTPPQVAATVALEGTARAGFLDAGETGRLKITLNNTGGTARNVTLRIYATESTAGLRFKNTEEMKTLEQDADQTIRIPITADKNIKGRDQGIEVQLLSKDGKSIARADLSFKIIPKTPAPIRPRR